MTLVYSARTFADVIFREELLSRAMNEPALSLRLTLTRERTPVAGHRLGRIDRALVDAALASSDGPPKRCFVCGATAFVEVATMFLIDAGIPLATIRTERYGGSPAEDLSPAAVMPET
jgi:ferredoxin-NADP reductase